MGKCSGGALQPRVGDRARRGGGTLGQRPNVWDAGTPHGSWGVGGGRGRGLTCVVPQPPPSPARDSLQSPRNLRVWQRCEEKGGSEAARSCPSLSCPPSPALAPATFPSPPPPARHPPSKDRVCGRSQALQTWSSLPGPLGRNLGLLGLEEHPSVGSAARSFQSSWPLQAVGESRPGWTVPGARREPAAAPGARIAAGLEADSGHRACGTRDPILVGTWELILDQDPWDLPNISEWLSWR